jgi:hypothetical protein
MCYVRHSEKYSGIDVEDGEFGFNYSITIPDTMIRQSFIKRICSSWLPNLFANDITYWRLIHITFHLNPPMNFRIDSKLLNII